MGTNRKNPDNVLEVKVSRKGKTYSEGPRLTVAQLEPGDTCYLENSFDAPRVKVTEVTKSGGVYAIRYGRLDERMAERVERVSKNRAGNSLVYQVHRKHPEIPIVPEDHPEHPIAKAKARAAQRKAEAKAKAGVKSKAEPKVNAKTRRTAKRSGNAAAPGSPETPAEASEVSEVLAGLVGRQERTEATLEALTTVLAKLAGDEEE